MDGKAGSNCSGAHFIWPMAHNKCACLPVGRDFGVLIQSSIIQSNLTRQHTPPLKHCYRLRSVSVQKRFVEEGDVRAERA